jgi:HEAT repeat protein
MLKSNDKEILDELRMIQKNKDNWENNIDFVAEKLNENYSVEVKAKALWVMGEMGLVYPEKVKVYIDKIAGYMEDEHPKLRERSVNALGRIGRADKNLIIPYLDKLIKTRGDEREEVRLSFVWACENIATNAPELFCKKLELFSDMFSDSGEKVRIEAPEMFRVVGKRKPECVKPYLDMLEYISQNDKHPIVRIHSEGAVRITKNALEKANT